MGRLPSLSDRRVFWRAALGFADLSRRAILRHATRPNPRLKADASFVTDADLAAERALRAAIARRFPDHGIVGEEFAPTRPDAPFQWIVDPIDGTLSFARGIPFYGTVLGLHHEGRPLVGVLDHPALGLRLSAAAGLGAWRDGRRLRLRDLRPGEPMARQVLATGDRNQFVAARREAGFDRLMRSGAPVRAYSDCMGHSLVAQGAVAAMADFALKIWDLAATQVLIEEAGGRFRLLRRYGDRGATSHDIVFGKPRAAAFIERFFPDL